jgi:putative membrane protein
MMNHKLAKVLCVASAATFCLFVAGGPARAQENTPEAQHAQRQNTRRMANPPHNDEAFVRNAAEGGMAEVKLGQLAEEKAQSEEVKKFGRRMVEDHTKANEELKQIAQRENINLPTAESRKDSQEYESLSKLSGEAFDRAYAQEMVKDHQKDVSEFKQMATSAQNPALKQFAQQTLPTLESHLQEARQMEQSVSRNAMGKTKR